MSGSSFPSLSFTMLVTPLQTNFAGHFSLCLAWIEHPHLVTNFKLVFFGFSHHATISAALMHLLRIHCCLLLDQSGSVGCVFVGPGGCLPLTTSWECAACACVLVADSICPSCSFHFELSFLQLKAAMSSMVRLTLSTMPSDCA